MDQQAAGGVVKIIFVAYFDQVKGLDQVDHAARIYIQSQPAQQTAKYQQIMQELPRAAVFQGHII